MGITYSDGFEFSDDGWPAKGEEREGVLIGKDRKAAQDIAVHDHFVTDQMAQHRLNYTAETCPVILGGSICNIHSTAPGKLWTEGRQDGKAESGTAEKARKMSEMLDERRKRSFENHPRQDPIDCFKRAVGGGNSGHETLVSDKDHERT